MGKLLVDLLDAIRRAKGPFFMARLALRVPFSLERPHTLDDGLVVELRRASRELGYDPVDALESG